MQNEEIKALVITHMGAILDKVAEMRRLQTLYFSTRDKNHLRAAKLMEAAVDGIIAKFKEHKQKAKQPSLFDAR